MCTIQGKHPIHKLAAESNIPESNILPLPFQVHLAAGRQSSGGQPQNSRGPLVVQLA